MRSSGCAEVSSHNLYSGGTDISPVVCKGTDTAHRLPSVAIREKNTRQPQIPPLTPFEVIVEHRLPQPNQIVVFLGWASQRRFDPEACFNRF